MATRKIRLTLSSEIVDDTGAIIDVDFNGENLETDYEVTAAYGTSTVVREYTVDVAAGDYSLDVTFKNDSALDTDGDLLLDKDRNLVIERVEIADDGVNYATHYWDEHCGFFRQQNPDYDPDSPTDWNALPAVNTPLLMNHPSFGSPTTFDPDRPRTDNSTDTRQTYVGDNPAFFYKEVTEHKIFIEGLTSIPVTFT